MRIRRFHLTSVPRRFAYEAEKFGLCLVPDVWPFKKFRQWHRANRFQRIYQKNTWGNTESVSGPGSTLSATEILRHDLPNLLAQLKVEVLLDAPCGDYNWFRHIQRHAAMRYIGGDIVPAIIERNIAHYATDNTRFEILDIVNDPLPHADLWLCRDCLFHFPLRDIHAVLGRFAHGDIAHLLTTYTTDSVANHEITLGDFRPLNLTLPPFRLPLPTHVIEEEPKNGEAKRLGLWTREQVRQIYV